MIVLSIAFVLGLTLLWMIAFGAIIAFDTPHTDTTQSEDYEVVIAD